MSKCCLMSHCLLIEIFVNADLEVADQRCIMMQELLTRARWIITLKEKI